MNRTDHRPLIGESIAQDQELVNAKNRLMSVLSPSKLLRIFVGERDRWKSQPLYTAVVEVLREAGVPGATVFRGIEGYGSHSVIHAARVFDLSNDLPLLIEVVDDEHRIRALLPTLAPMLVGCLATLESVEILFPQEKTSP